MNETLFEKKLAPKFTVIGRSLRALAGILLMRSGLFHNVMLRELEKAGRAQ
jgi:hypothetical protein